MKTLPAALSAHITTRETKLATALKITRPDGAIYGFTTHDKSDTISGVVYSASPGLDVTDIVISANAAVGNLELTTLHDGTLFTSADVLGGRWRNSQFAIFRYNWASLSDGIDTLLAGNFGEVEILHGSVVAELRDLRQHLQQTVGDSSSKNCRARLGDARCLKDLTTFTYTGTVTSVVSKQVFYISTSGLALDWFAEGRIIWTSGANNGLSAKIKSSAATTISITLSLPMFGTVAVGDAYTIIAGCRKRLAEDCITKFNNVLNFVGEPHRRGLNDLLGNPTPNV